MHDWKKAFGEPDAAFEQRVQRTLRRIQEKEEAKVKKKLTLSIAIAFALCLTVITLSALAATDFLGVIKPDVTLNPLSQSASENPTDMPLPAESTPTPLPAVTMVPDETLVPDVTPMPTGDIRSFMTPTPMATAEMAMAMPTPMPKQTDYNYDGAGIESTLKDIIETRSTAYYTTRTDDYYHETYLCFAEGAEKMPDYVIPITQEEAEASGRKLCLKCIYTEGLWYYATDNGDFYHGDRYCSGMKNASLTHISELEALQKEPCPVCISLTVYTSDATPFYHSLSGCFGVFDLDVMNSKEAQAQAKDPCPVCMKALYYFVSDQDAAAPYYHVTPECSRAYGALPGTLVSAKMYDKEPCPECIGNPVFCTPHGAYYHTDTACSGMVCADEVPAGFAEVVMGKKACPVCAAVIPKATAVPAKDAYYYSAIDAYFHAMTSCPAFTHSEGKTNAAKLEAIGKLPCEKCVNVTFYIKDALPFYHSVLGCFGEWELNAISSDTPKIERFEACPQCVEELFCFLPAVNADYPYFHVSVSCPDLSAVELANRGTLNDAFSMGKVACPECTQMYYCNLKGSVNYHISASCPGLEPETAGMVLEGTALNMGKVICPLCTAPLPTHTPAPEVNSGSTVVYNSSNGFYHIIPNCPQAERYGEPVKTTDSMALAAGSIVCDECVRCYMEDEIEMYHMDRNCPAVYGNLSSVIWMDVMNIGAGLEYSACGECTFLSEGKDAYYHGDVNCAEKLTGGTNMFPGTEAYMLRIGKSPCPDCMIETAEVQPTQTPPLMENPSETDSPSAIASSCSVPLTLDLPQPGYSEEMRVINFIAEGFGDGQFYADGNSVTHYLLCETMNAPSAEFRADILRIYGGPSPEELSVIADFR